MYDKTMDKSKKPSFFQTKSGQRFLAIVIVITAVLVFYNYLQDHQLLSLVSAVLLVIVGLGSAIQSMYSK